MTLLPQLPGLSPIELGRGELDRRVRREYPMRESELLQCLMNFGEGLPSTLKKNKKKNCWNNMQSSK